MDWLNIIFGGGHIEIQYGRHAKCVLLYSASTEQDRNIASGCTYIFLVEETDGPIYKLFYCGSFEIQDGHHIGSNLVNISPAAYTWRRQTYVLRQLFALWMSWMNSRRGSKCGLRTQCSGQHWTTSQLENCCWTLPCWIIMLVTFLSLDFSLVTSFRMRHASFFRQKCLTLRGHVIALTTISRSSS